MRMKRLKNTVAFVIVAVVVLAALLAVSARIPGGGFFKKLQGGRSDGAGYLAGGCFWCMQSDFQKIPGVKKVVSGYIGGTGKNPTYDNYAENGYIEAIRITYDPSVIPYEKLLNQYWLHIDPTDAGGQFCDRGHAYISAIFYENDEQKRLAEQSKAALEKSGRVEKAGCNQNPQGRYVLSCRGVSSGLLRKESHTI